LHTAFCIELASKDRGQKTAKEQEATFLKGSTLSACKHGNAQRHVTSNSVWRTGCSPNRRAGDGKAPGTHISVSQLLIASHLRLPYLIRPALLESSVRTRQGQFHLRRCLVICSYLQEESVTVWRGTTTDRAAV
jgi:hypothetical protein